VRNAGTNQQRRKRREKENDPGENVRKKREKPSEANYKRGRNPGRGGERRPEQKVSKPRGEKNVNPEKSVRREKNGRGSERERERCER